MGNIQMLAALKAGGLLSEEILTEADPAKFKRKSTMKVGVSFSSERMQDLHKPNMTKMVEVRHKFPRRLKGSTQTRRKASVEKSSSSSDCSKPKGQTVENLFNNLSKSPIKVLGSRYSKMMVDPDVVASVMDA